MKKIYAIVSILLISATLVSGQIIDSYHPTLDYTGPADATLNSAVDIENKSTTTTLNVLCERYSQTLLPNHYSYFCWVVCYDTSVIVSPSPITLAPMTSTNYFKGYIVPSNVVGLDEITYRFYDQSGLADTLYLTFTFDFTIPTGIAKVNVSKHSMSIVGANPANTNTLISYTTSSSRDARIVVTNLLGSKISEFNLGTKAGTVTLPVSDLTQGVYVCSLIVDGSVVTSKKLIVSHR